MADNKLIKWDGSRFTIDKIRFQSIESMSDMFTLNDIDGHIIAKQRRYIEKYIQHFSGMADIKNIFELGIFRGGSTVFLSKFFNPTKLVAIDYSKNPVTTLTSFIETSEKSDSIRPYYGVDQADIPRLEEIVIAEFSGESLDLVIDDASHMLEESRASFNCLFPKLRANGLYVIEDWAWAHNKSVTSLIRDTNPLLGKASLANLIIEIQLAAVSAPGLIDEVIVNDAFVVVRKGFETAPSAFDVSDYGLTMDVKTKGHVFIR